MQQRLLLTAAINGFLAVALGAFGAHGLAARLAQAENAVKRLEWWNTASHYHLIHALALGLLAALCPQLPARWAIWAGSSWGIGILLFCGSLYAMSASGRTSLAVATPFGGLALLAGWTTLAIGAARLVSR
jgi:uncharacterized membrane protein YgdD (TMEM256/DUF423 family)